MSHAVPVKTAKMHTNIPKINGNPGAQPPLFLWLCPWISPSIPGKRADNICWTMRMSCGLWYLNCPNGLQTKSSECSTFHITPSCFRTVAVFSHNWPIQSQRNLFNGSHLRLLAFPLEATIDWWPAHLLAAYVENHYRWRRLSIGQDDLLA